MARYFTQRRPSQWIEDDTEGSEPFRPSLIVSEHVATGTGLLDANGDPIMRAPNPVGFGRDGEW